MERSGSVHNCEFDMHPAGCRAATHRRNLKPVAVAAPKVKVMSATTFVGEERREVTRGEQLQNTKKLLNFVRRHVIITM